MEMKYLLRRKQYTAALVCVGSWRVENKTITTAQCSETLYNRIKNNNDNNINNNINNNTIVKQ